MILDYAPGEFFCWHFYAWRRGRILIMPAQWLSCFLPFSYFSGLENIKLEKAVSAFCFCNGNSVRIANIERHPLDWLFVPLCIGFSCLGRRDCGTLIARSRLPWFHDQEAPALTSRLQSKLYFSVCKSVFLRFHDQQVPELKSSFLRRRRLPWTTVTPLPALPPQKVTHRRNRKSCFQNHFELAS